MSRLLLVRHGQASFFGGDYDQLSPQGLAQARRLGQHLADTGVSIDISYVGPLRRHRETAAAVATTYRAACGDWPAEHSVETLAEHAAAAVMKSVLGLTEASGNGGLSLTPSEDPAERQRLVRDYFRRWEQVSRRWIDGEFTELPHESWQSARRRAAEALALMTAPGRTGETRIAFSSGGLICMIVGELLGLDDQRIFDLSLVFGNSAMAEIRFSGQRRTLAGFNLTPHLVDQGLATMV
ncbi:MAG: histidine phosphatase family protein [Gammaproteobacteria bacterium]|nr:histidine phosphatase family protein [Gammaproteobacteria bacterium]